MFQVRSAPAHATHLTSRAHAARHLGHRPHALPSPVLAFRIALIYACLWTRQSTNTFNQPLSFDTSSVTSMSYMFQVRLRTCPNLHLDAPPMLPRAIHRPPPPGFAYRPLPMPPFGPGSRQGRSTNR